MNHQVEASGFGDVDCHRRALLAQSYEADFDHLKLESSRPGSRKGSSSSWRTHTSAANSSGSRKMRLPLRASRIRRRGPLPLSSRSISTDANSLLSVTGNPPHD